ncbi:sugar ABC transporter permease [Mesorhizobium sp. BR1-1-16]|uniref:carbohydrate ABC transporter permease n=1 Tax=Mesorhizobium sp. BR1-1-16 TaxID=2876653 RepID=UPI001CCEF88B|nr:sugar ABC transporter permease [Mesorhizobium sp. BR1-1-16]
MVLAARSNRASYALLAGPAIVIYGLVIVVPVLYSLVLSFTDWAGMGVPNFVGFTNYVVMFSDPIFWWGLRNNGLVVLVSLIGQIPLGFFLAYVIYRRLVRHSGFFEAVIFFPALMSPVVVALLFGVVFAPSGLVAEMIGRATGNPMFSLTIFNTKNTAIIPYLIVLLWMYTGIYFIIFLANLQKTSPEMLEAAVLDGASEWNILKSLIVPQQIPVFLTSAIYAVAGSLKSFEILWIMTNGGPSYYSNVLGLYMIQNTFSFYKYGFGSAIAIVVILLSVFMILILSSIAARFSRRFEQGAT